MMAQLLSLFDFRIFSKVMSEFSLNYIVHDCEYIDDTQFSKVYDLASNCRKQVKGFRKYLRDYNSQISKS